MPQSIAQFRERVDGAPIEVLEAAYEATEVTDDEALRLAGQELVNAHEAFTSALESREVELG